MFSCISHQRKIVANWTFEHKLLKQLSEYLSMGVTEKGFRYSEIYEYCFKIFFTMGHPVFCQIYRVR